MYAYLYNIYCAWTNIITINGDDEDGVTSLCDLRYHHWWYINIIHLLFNETHSIFRTMSGIKQMLVVVLVITTIVLLVVVVVVVAVVKIQSISFPKSKITDIKHNAFMNCTYIFSVPKRISVHCLFRLQAIVFSKARNGPSGEIRRKFNLEIIFMYKTQNTKHETNDWHSISTSVLTVLHFGGIWDRCSPNMVCKVSYESYDFNGNFWFEKQILF